MRSASTQKSITNVYQTDRNLYLRMPTDIWAEKDEWTLNMGSEFYNLRIT